MLILLRTLAFCALLVLGCAVFNPNRFLGQLPIVKQHAYDTLYLDVLLDHFTFVENRAFKMKYLISTTHHVANGPVLFYTGNEGDIETFAENSGFIWEHAEELQAAVVFAEHRYYGCSLPFGNDSLTKAEYFGYLTVEQTLADFVSLIHHLKQSNVTFKNSPFIAFGGSYGGMLSSWMRQKYPNMIAGAIAASAPVWMFRNMSDCKSFFQTTTNAFVRCGSKECTQNLAAVWNGINEIAKGPSGLQLLHLIFNTCGALTDGQSLINYLVDLLGTVAMVNYPYEASFIGSFPANPVQYFCTNLTHFNPHADVLDTVRLVAQAVRSLVNYTGTSPCIDIEGSLPGLNARGWELQTCLEMTNPICADGINDMFPPSEWDAEAFSESCSVKHGVRPRMDWSSLEFWGKRLSTATNIVFSNGDLDPWSTLGVLNQQDVPICHVIRMPNAAHHLDLRAAHPLDPADVTEARQLELKFIKSWITEWAAGRGVKQ